MMNNALAQFRGFRAEANRFASPQLPEIRRSAGTESSRILGDIMTCHGIGPSTRRDKTRSHGSMHPRNTFIDLVNASSRVDFGLDKHDIHILSQHLSFLPFTRS